MRVQALHELRITRYAMEAKGPIVKIEVVKTFKIELDSNELDTITKAIHFGVLSNSLNDDESQFSAKFLRELAEKGFEF